MSKKEFKTGAEKFISAFDTPKTQETVKPQWIPKTPKTHYRINLKLRPQYHEYLTEESWKAKKSITEFMNDLIEEHRKNHQ